MRILLVLLVWLIGTACHSSGGSVDAGVPWYSGGNGAGAASGASGAGGVQTAVTNPSAPADDAAIAEYVQTWCGWYQRCGALFYRDMDDCVEAMTCSTGGLLESIPVTRGELLGCSRSVVGLPCELTQLPLDTSCVQLGNTIASTFGDELGCGGTDCDAESYCDRDEPQCPRCVARVRLGESCLNTRCVTGTYCDETTLRCETVLTEGMACENHAACRDSETFGPEAWRRCRDGHCANPSALGEACEMPADCALFLTCLNGVCSERKELGESCTSHSECKTSSYCLQGTCAQLCGYQNQGVGESCLFDLHCDQSFCDPVTSTCEAFKAQGAACTTTPECGAGFFCKPSSSTCAAVTPNGAVCELHVGCMSGLCEEQRCQQLACN